MKTLLYLACVVAPLCARSQANTTPLDITYQGHAIHFYRFLPRNYTGAGAYKHPLIISIHGSGETGAAIFQHGIPRLIQNNATMKFRIGTIDHSFVVLIPQLITNSLNGNPLPFDHYFVDAMIDYAINNLNIDKNKIFITGYSLGGGEVWDYASNSGQRASKLAGILPVSGAPYQPVQSDLCRISSNGVGIYAFHGQYDPTVPLSKASAAVDYVNNSCPSFPTKLTAKLRTYMYGPDPFYGHNDIWNMAYDTTNAYQNPNMFQWMISTSRSTSGSLPVELMYFKGKNLGSNNILIWATAKEINAERFDILRSADGEHYETIGQVPVLKSASAIKEYSYKDEMAPKGSSYYRLKQIDKDGMFTLSASRALRNTNQMLVIEKYPNPFNDEFKLNIEGNIFGSLQIRIFDSQGRLLQKTSIRKQQSSWTGIVSVKHLAKGTYYIEVRSANEKLDTSKFVKI